MGVFDSVATSNSVSAMANNPPPIIADDASGEVTLNLKMANRHGLIAGATGTGKTVSLQRMAEQMARAGVTVFCVDVKGDLSGMAAATDGNGPQAVFWDVYGKQGHPLRTTLSELGPVLLARLLNASDAQAGILQIAFKLADDQQLLLLDLKDLKAILSYMAENATDIGRAYGLVSPASVSGLQRAILAFENEDGAVIFGEPALEVSRLLQKDADGRGLIHILSADQLMKQPRLYATVMLWLISELYEDLPEAGDLPQPKLALFIDEAHLLFNDAPKVLVDKIEQVIRLICSKSVGITFITQNPLDLPTTVLGQLGNRLQHALRAFTPKDQKDVRAAAQTFRSNPAFDTETMITQLGVGEALISFLDAKGQPSMVQKAKVRLPESALGVLPEATRRQIIASSPYFGLYEQEIDRESAFEKLGARYGGVQKTQEQTQAQIQGQAQQATGTGGGILGAVAGLFTNGSSRRQSVGEAMVKSVVRSVGAQVGREIMRGILGSARRR